MLLVAAKTQSFCGFEDDKMCGFTHERQLTLESDSNSLLGVLLVCHKAK
jgi:hypothetical protein